MEWISPHIMEILTLALVITTGIYAFLTWRHVCLTRETLRTTLEENQQMRIDAQKPKIEIYPYEIYETLGRSNKAQSIYLYVENRHMGPASNVDFELVDRRFKLPGRGSEVRLLKDIPLIQHGISHLPPGQNRNYRLSSEHEYGAHCELMQQQTQIKVTYKDSRGETYNDCFCLDFRIYARQ